MIPSGMVPYVLLIGRVLLIYVGYVWLEDELYSGMFTRQEMDPFDRFDRFGRGWAGVLPFSATCIGIMGLGALLAYCGWASLP